MFDINIMVSQVSPGKAWGAHALPKSLELGVFSRPF